MKEVRNKQGELTGYESENKEIQLNDAQFYHQNWFLTIPVLNINSVSLCPKQCDIEHIKDKIYDLLDEKEKVIENLKKLIAK